MLCSLAQQQMFEEDNQHAREIPGQCQQRDFTQVPAEFDLFQSHRHYSCGRSDNQQAAAHAGAESQQVPEDTVPMSNKKA